ncbi:hypothetical protein ZIOFF_019382 [Zingiber officinale]|uniref:glycerophosphodiester phosphodiesterase n=1 Tax=Zingiber officinale TaxID=94328 RepID=A0A8J5H9H6_ZINOF|nr:hypothetical protein ZIOFF_019382 [Zingiber officinale]
MARCEARYCAPVPRHLRRLRLRWPFDCKEAAVEMREGGIVARCGQNWHISVPRDMLLRITLLVLLLHEAAAANLPAKWQTLNGAAPLVIARGGFSGVFPDSSQYAYQFAQANSLKNVVLYCNLQLTKDGAGICHTDYRLDNSTTISSAFPKDQKTYTINGQQVQGWFAVDFTSEQLYNNVSLIQNIFSRPSIFDASLPISMVEDVTGLHPSQFWINLHCNYFFKAHNLDAVDYITSVSGQVVIDFISSPEIDFLRSLKGKLGRAKTKVIFKFLEVDDVEPSSNKTYKALLTDLATIKSFASGILVPKSYIWPVNEDQYLETHTSLVTDAHALGLEVYAFNFANDMPASYNYSFDPTTEYLQFIDNSNFSVDGVITDFPSTASEAIACLAHSRKNVVLNKGRPLIITHNGASGVFAGSTDLAYQQAVADGADIIDCSVQMSKDGVAFCLESPDLMGHTTAVQTFMLQATTVPEIQSNNGIFSFDLSWSDIQSLKPELTSPISQSGMARNPAAKNAGKFMILEDFLNFAKNSTVPGILINIEIDVPSLFVCLHCRLLAKRADVKASSENERLALGLSANKGLNAAYLASKRGLGIVDAISTALSNASYDQQPSSFINGFTDIVKQMHTANMSVHVSVLRNEFMAIAFDYFSDPMVELATFVASVEVDGMVTEFPATAAAYFRSPCSDPNAKLDYSILPIEPGSLLDLAPPEALPPAEAPAPPLQVADIQDPPLPPVTNLSQVSSVAPPTTSPSGQSANVPSITLGLLLLVLSSIYDVSVKSFVYGALS